MIFFARAEGSPVFGSKCRNLSCLVRKKPGAAVWDPFEREDEFAKMFGATPTFPYVLGADGAGTVAAVGAQVRRFKEGDHALAPAPAFSTV